MADLDSMNLGQLQALMTDLEALAKAGAILTRAGMNPVFSLAPGQVATISTGAVLVEAAPPSWGIEGGNTPSLAELAADWLRPSKSDKTEGEPLTVTIAHPGPLADRVFQDALTSTLVDLAVPAAETPQSPPPESVAAPAPGIDAPPAVEGPAGGAASKPMPSPQPVVSSPPGPGVDAPSAVVQHAAEGAASEPMPSPQPVVSSLPGPGVDAPPAEEQPAGGLHDPFFIHWMALPDDGWTPAQDREFIELVCADWMWPELTVELGREKKALLRRYDQLTGLYVDDATGKQARRFNRERVLAGLQAAVPDQAA